MTTTYHIDTDRLTVIATDSHGEPWDLNALGDQCANADDLAAFVRELCTQGLYDAEQRDALLEAL